jgi:hypothetical protein
MFFKEFDVKFLTSFIFATVVQILAWNLFTYHHRAKIIARNQDIDILALEQISHQQVQLPCAACGIPTLVPIELNTDNRFDCPACDQKNSVYIEIETAATTTIDNNNG